jgi:two-component system response regulator PilR (NtrC family)
MEDSGPLVLVVDDDPSLRFLARINLEIDGFQVREAASLDEAREAVGEKRPDVVFLDVHLGAESSNLLLEELRGAGIPVVLVTGTADVDDYRDRANAVLGKPFLPEALVSYARELAAVG